MMKRKHALLLVGCLGLLIVGVLINRVGNVSVRRVQSDGHVPMTYSEPVIPGVETLVRWTPPAAIGSREVVFELRTLTLTETIGRANIVDGVATVVFPCAADAVRGSFSMLTADTGELLAWRQARMLPAGPDCI